MRFPITMALNIRFLMKALLLLRILLVDVVSDYEPQFSVVVLDVKPSHVNVLQGPWHYLVELCEVPLPLKDVNERCYAYEGIGLEDHVI